MSSIFNTLNIGYSGLNAAQVGIDVTGHNISNAEVDGYTRQRVVQSAATPLYTAPGNVGNGTEIDDISRIFDNYVFDRYNSVSADKEYSDYEMQTLDELSTYFPEIDGVGIKADLASYYDMWQTFADNPTNDAVKSALAQQTETLSSHITQTREQVSNLQQQVNDQIGSDVDEVNSLAKELADLNKAIDTAEAGGGYTANDLRDRRNVIERDLSRLIGAEVNSGQITSNITVDSNANSTSGSYTLSVNGVNLVDGSTYHPIKAVSEDNANGFYSLYYERQDGQLIPIEENINGGRIGAELNLRGNGLDPVTGQPNDGVLQTTLDDLDAFAKGLIESTNNLYAQAATQSMDSNRFVLDGTDPIVNSDLNVKQGSFDVVVYDLDGNEVSRRAISIDEATSLASNGTGNSIEEQMGANVDDNGDNNANNDVDDYVSYSYQTAADGTSTLTFIINPDAQSQGYTFAIEDNLSDESFNSGTNFAGAFGVGRFFDGDSAKNIDLTSSLKNNSSDIRGGYSSSDGDNRVALDMIQQQYENYDFEVGGEIYNTTIYGMFDMTATYVGVTTNAAITRNDTVTTQFSATQKEYDSVSKVNIDEELTNLIKYQTSYGAAAKVISTVDQMMQTLLGMKQ